MPVVDRARFYDRDGHILRLDRCHGSAYRRDGERIEPVEGGSDEVLLSRLPTWKPHGFRVRAGDRKQIGTTLMKTNPTGGGIVYYSEIAKKARNEGKELTTFQKSVLLRRQINLEKEKEFKNNYGLRDSDEVRNAAILFALDNLNVNSAILTFFSFEDVDRLLRPSGKRFNRKK